MQEVKIKNLNKSHMKKGFIVKGRFKYTKVKNNKNSDGKHLYSILFDDSSEIEVVAFKDCDEVSKLLSTGDVVKIENAVLNEVNKDYKKTKHKYKIVLLSNSIITTVNKDEVNNNDFPIHKYTSGAALKSLIPGMIIDVSGVLVQINSEIEINTQSQTFRKGIIKVDSTEIDVRFYGEKAEKIYNVGNKLILSSVKYTKFKGYEYLSVGHSSSVKCILHQLPYVPDADLEIMSNRRSRTVRLLSRSNVTIGSPDQKQSTSGSTPCKKNSTIESSINRVSISSPSSSNKNFTIESPDQKQSTSGSTPCNKNSTIESSVNRFSISSPSSSNKSFTIESLDQNQLNSYSTPCKKRKSQDFNVEEVTSKIIKIDEPKESFSDEKFTKVVLNLLKNIKNNKEVVKLRIIEFISEILPENDK